MRARWAWALAMVLGVGALTWLVWPEATEAVGRAGAAPGERAAGGAGAGAEGEGRLGGLFGRAARFIEVEVTACGGAAGAGVEVIAERGGRTYTARAGEDGRARLDVEGAGEVQVRARVGSYRTEAEAVVGARAELVACPGARVHGVVRAPEGGPLGGLSVQLVGGRGEVLDAVETDAEGSYAVEDGMLEGATLVVLEGGAEVARRELAPLAAREDRAVDVVLGDVREVVGWVLDLEGEPQGGVAVTLIAEAAGARWTTFTDAGGGFAFREAPASALRVEADGGELGRAAGRLATSEALRREVTLTLEPVATITVVAADPTVVARVEIRCWDRRFHGPDGLMETLWEPPAFDPAADGGDTVPPEVTGEEAPATSFPDPEQTMRVFEEALRAYDPGDPEESTVQLLMTVFDAMPELRGGMFDDELPPDADRATLERVVRAKMAEEIAKNPEQLEYLGLMAAEIQGGKSLMEASQVVAERAMAQGEGAEGAEGGEGTGESAVDEVPEGPITDGEPPMTGEYPDEASWRAAHAEGGPQSDVYVPPLEYDPYGNPIPQLDTRALVAQGGLGEALTVRASFMYDVSVVLADGTTQPLGMVFVNPGDELVLPLDHAGPTTLTGRVIDVAGQPVSGVRVATSHWEERSAAHSGADGTFELVTTLPGVATVSVTFEDPQGRFEMTLRRSISVIGGHRRDLGDIVVRRAEEEPPPQMAEAYGGIGGLIQGDDLGVLIEDVEPESPLALHGIEAGDTLTTIDGVPAAELPMNELLLRLRGEAGTTVQLRVRTGAGELYDIAIQRETIQPYAAWSRVDDGPPAVDGP